jgi:S-DNA-T family DNA segregation ATPase FtsK/SpoIIIE
MADRMPIGYDLSLLCDAVDVVTRLKRVGASTVQRKVRVGFVKAEHLILLLEDYGVIGPRDAKGWHPVLVAYEDHVAVISRLRKTQALEATGG